ncbi:adenine deaminase C-terminal domain-containing protein [Paenibacillus validus]|uniref:adenine deaminase C-terminal domain-containing protein n=1 Tax=Paenibacillus validus TaxID=44253 RepID=UPI000FDB439A|nr:adenine deaminase C-terminal domain-containing protein [Paenibacillus validus]MED4602027.1 adenine deaminase C-terminal domain-containing protein [Paenibacillus validus]MED4607294.1 adenine deaminase C-terminal domain-containing protein [Paenibacillus validus]
MKWRANRYELIEVSKGQRPADLFIQGGTVVNVYSGELLPQNVAVYKDRIAYVGESCAMVGENTRVIDAEGQFVCPGFIEVHAHPWVIYNPVSLAAQSVSTGTTTIVNDNLFFYLHMGAQGFKRMVEDLRELPGNQLWLARLVSQAEFIGERDWFNHADLRMLLDMEEVVGTAEVTRWPLLYEGDPFLIETIEYAKKRGKLSDGHTAGCSYEKLNAIAASGISACHEAITAQETLDRLRLGLWTNLRNSSLRPDLEELIKAITEGKVDTHRLLMTTDGPHPAFILEEGFVNGLVRKAVRLGLPPVQAIQLVTVNAATFLRLDEEIGGIAPSRRADIIILPDLEQFEPSLVISGGETVFEGGSLQKELPHIDWSRYRIGRCLEVEKSVLANPDIYRFPHPNPDVPVPVIGFRSTVITKGMETTLPSKDGYADIAGKDGLLHVALIDRFGKWRTNGLIEGFADKLEGMASTYNTPTDLLAIGKNPEAMARAAASVHEMGGGIAIVQDGKLALEIPLPVGGMMTDHTSFAQAVNYQNELLAALKRLGYPFHDILYTLLFLTCDFLPGLRIVPLGVYDVKSHSVLRPPVPLQG